jgi:signal transduction histidine kinase
VCARAEDDSVVVEIADTGIGIPADMLGSVFDEFVQVSGTAPDEGSGLGLAVCRRLVSALGSRIEADSEEGEGSTFRLWLPRWPE